MYTANVNIAVILQIICLYCTNDFLVDGQVQIKTCENNTVNKQRNFQYKLLIHWYGILLIIILSLCKVNMNNLKHQFSVCYFCPYLKNVYIHIIWTLNMKFSHLLKNVGWNSNKVFSRLHLKSLKEHGLENGVLGALLEKTKIGIWLPVFEYQTSLQCIQQFWKVQTFEIH